MVSLCVYSLWKPLPVRTPQNIEIRIIGAFTEADTWNQSCTAQEFRDKKCHTQFDSSAH